MCVCLRLDGTDTEALRKRRALSDATEEQHVRKKQLLHQSLHDPCWEWLDFEEESGDELSLLLTCSATFDGQDSGWRAPPLLGSAEAGSESCSREEDACSEVSLEEWTGEEVQLTDLTSVRMMHPEDDQLSQLSLGHWVGQETGSGFSFSATVLEPAPSCSTGGIGPCDHQEQVQLHSSGLDCFEAGSLSLRDFDFSALASVALFTTNPKSGPLMCGSCSAEAGLQSLHPASFEFPQLLACGGA